LHPLMSSAFSRRTFSPTVLVNSQSMWRLGIGVLSFLLIGASASLGCWCGLPGPASGYVNDASVVFVGKVLFNDDDGSGKFTQKTLVRFAVEESYKGLGPDIHDVWVDPGSFTSCYAAYPVGNRYLVFAHDRNAAPRDTLSITVVPTTTQSKPKPVPPGFDQKNRKLLGADKSTACSPL
jgi:hypothetical protein